MTLTEFREYFQRGDNYPMEHLFEEYGNYCVSNLQRKTSCDVEDAKDIFIEAILVFRENVISGKIQELTNLKSYLYTTCINMQKSRKREQQRPIDHENRIKAYFYDLVEGEGAMATEEISKEMMFEACNRALSGLGEKCSELLKRFYFDRASLETIVEAMGFANKDVAKSTKSRCMKQWKRLSHDYLKSL